MIGPILILAAFAVLFVIVATDLEKCCHHIPDSGSDVDWEDAETDFGHLFAAHVVGPEVWGSWTNADRAEAASVAEHFRPTVEKSIARMAEWVERTRRAG